MSAIALHCIANLHNFYHILQCHVPTKYKENSALGRWISKQRAAYKKYRKGEKSNMTADKIRRLESIGFAWFML